MSFLQLRSPRFPNILATPPSVVTTKFLEPGGDANYSGLSSNGFWSSTNNTPTVATDFVHGNHQKSFEYFTAAGAKYQQRNNVLSDSGSRSSVYYYFNALPSSSGTIATYFSPTNAVVRIRITSAGVLQLFNHTAQIGTNGATLSTGVWYRISLAYTVTSTSVNRFELFVDGASTISITDATLSIAGSVDFRIGNISPDTTLDMRTSDIYIDNSPSLTDTGDIWVTAKRPFSNGTTNDFTTQIGVSGSGYGTGHSPQVNERALSTTNGWSMVGAGVPVIEEYNIESKSTGDIDISTSTMVDWLGWVSISSLASETIQIITDGSNSAQGITSTNTIYTKIKGSTTYPSGTGADIGVITDTTLTTVSLYECGVIVAYIPLSGGSLYLQELLEVITYTDSLMKQTYKQLTETITFTDTLTRLITKVLTDTITYTDIILKSIYKVLTETITYTDTLLKLTGKVLTETLTFTDSLIRDVYKVLTETITFTDSLIRQTYKVLTETVTYTDILTAIRAIFLTLTETITYTDSLVKDSFKVLSETITYTDSILKSIGKILTEDITFTDILTTIKSGAAAVKKYYTGGIALAKQILKRGIGF